MRKGKDIVRIKEEAISVMAGYGLHVDRRIPIDFRKKLSKPTYWAQCELAKDIACHYRVAFRWDYYFSDVSDHDIVETLIHEYLHTLFFSDGHRGKWKKWANRISEDGVYIITTRNDERLFVKPEDRFKLIYGDVQKRILEEGNILDVLDVMEVDYEEDETGKIVCTCPFHDNEYGWKTMTIDIDKNKCSCSWCRNGGNMINLFKNYMVKVMGEEDFKYIEAMQYVADICELDINVENEKNDLEDVWEDYYKKTTGITWKQYLEWENKTYRKKKKGGG